MKKLFSFFCCGDKTANKIILGIGNPGTKYDQTRHNIGFEVIDCLAKELGVSCNQKKFSSLTAFAKINDENVLLMKPLTFVNVSGVAAKKALNHFGLENTSILVVVDDIHLPVGKIRIRHRGRSGGHNGLKSLSQHLGTDQFSRLKVGIGNNKEQELVQYVLSKFPHDEIDTINEAVVAAKEKCKQWLLGKL